GVSVGEGALISGAVARGAVRRAVASRAAARFESRVGPRSACVAILKAATDSVTSALLQLGKVLMKEAPSKLYTVASVSVAIDQVLSRPSGRRHSFGSSSEIRRLETHLRAGAVE